jgi:hypothetical protein
LPDQRGACDNKGDLVLACDLVGTGASGELLHGLDEPHKAGRRLAVACGRPAREVDPGAAKPPPGSATPMLSSSWTSSNIVRPPTSITLTS